jgi:hypothetical protein
VLELKVMLDITHSEDQQLHAFLVSPSGKRVELFSDVGGTGDNFTGTTLWDGAATSITAGAAPFSGTFRPEEPLSNLRHLTPNGLWQLQVYDDLGTVGFAHGRINSWAMEITYGDPREVTMNGAYDFTGVPPGSYRVREAPRPGWRQTYPANPAYYDVALASGSAFASANFYNTTRTRVTGTIFHDADASGTRGSAEPGLAGQAVYIDANNNGMQDSNEPATPTDPDGNWTIDGLTPGTYVIRNVPRPNWSLTAPQEGFFEIVAEPGGVMGPNNVGLIPTTSLVMGRLKVYGDVLDDAIVLDRDPTGRIRIAIDSAEYTFDVGDVAHVEAWGLGGSDVLVIRAPLGAGLMDVMYDGGDSGGPLESDSLEIMGGGALACDYTPSSTVPGAGMIGIHGLPVHFTGLEPVTVSNVGALTMNTPNGSDNLTIDSPLPGRNRVRGTSGGVAFESLTFFNVPGVIIDAGANDGAAPHDLLTIDAPGLVAAGLASFRFRAGAGNNRLAVNGGVYTFDQDAALDSSNLTVSAGSGATVRFNATQHLNSVGIANGAQAIVAPGGNKVLVTRTLGVAGRLDLSDNDLIVDYNGVSPLAVIGTLLASGYAGGAWNGAGINTSMGNPVALGLGYAEASDVAPGGTFVGQPVDGSAVLVRFTRYGDANLDGTVNLQDFNRLAANFGQAPRRWAQGNFDYDAGVNLSDFNRLAAQFGAATSGGQTSPLGGTGDEDEEVA